MKRLIALLIVLLLPLPVTRAETDTGALSAAGYALYESASGRLLASYHGDQRAFMASTTKIMTALIALEQGDLSARVTVPDSAVGTEGSSMYLARDEKLTLEDLLYGLMLVSGNDAAVTIATHIAGSVEGFAQKMNEKAAALGCHGTHFVNPNGLPDERHYTTAEDLGRIAATAMQNPNFRKIVGAAYYQTLSGDRTRTLKNKNKILWEYEGGNGVKTGYTKAAGKCLVFSAERNGMVLVGALLNAPDMWNDAIKLLDYGFGLVERKRLVSRENPLASIEIAKGEKKELAVYAKEDILYPVKVDGSDRINWKLSIERGLTAPVEQGAVCGQLVLELNGECAFCVPLEVRESVLRTDLRYYFKSIIDGWTG